MMDIVKIVKEYKKPDERVSLYGATFKTNMKDGKLDEVFMLPVFIGYIAVKMQDNFEVTLEEAKTKQKQAVTFAQSAVSHMELVNG